MTEREGEHCNDVEKRDLSRWPDWLIKAKGKMPGEHGSAWLDHTGTFRVCGSSIETGYRPVPWGSYIVLTPISHGLIVWTQADFEEMYEAVAE